MRGKVLLKLDLSVVQNGSTWRIGDGHQVRIRGDKWLPDKHSSRITSPQRNLPSNALVCSFIDENGPRWVEDRVCSEFYPHEARIVLGIPLSSRLPPDKLIWTGTKSGRYSTRSAYKLLEEKPNSGLHRIHQHIAGFGSSFGHWRSQIKSNTLSGVHAVNRCPQRRTYAPGN